MNDFFDLDAPLFRFLTRVADMGFHLDKDTTPFPR